MAESRVVLVLAASSLLVSGAAGAQGRDRDWCQDVSDWGDRYDRHCEVREYTLGAGGRLSVDAKPNGGIEVRGWDRNEIRVEARVVAQAESEAEARRVVSEVEIETSGTIRADGPRSERRRSWSVSYRLNVPRNADLSLTSMNGGITVRAVQGDLDLQTMNGGLTLEDLGGNLRGRTTNGGVELRLSGTEWRGDGVDLRTTNGGVRVHVPNDYNAHLETGTTHGGLQVDFPVTIQGRIDRELSVDLGKGGAPIRVTTTNGGVAVRRR